MLLKQQRFVRYGHDATVCITLHVLLLSGISCTYFIFHNAHAICVCVCSYLSEGHEEFCDIES